jgi:polar amino acid transport system permease protein
MQWSRVAEHLPALVQGGLTTLALSAVAITLALTLGIAIGLMRRASAAIVRLPARAFIDVVRGTPLLIQLYLLYFGLPSLGIRFEPFAAAVIALGVNTAAYIAEIVRAAIQSVPKQHIESGLALGLSRFRILWRVIAPQALLVALPAVTNELVDIVKWSSVAAMVVVSEMTQVFYTIVGRTFYLVELFIVVAVFYLAVTASLSALLRWLESRLARYRLGWS